MKVKRLYEMSALERAIMLMIWSDVKDLPEYQSWRSYERGFSYEGKPYRYKCKYKVEEGHLQLIEAFIEHEQVVVDLVH